jgi:hypothetical protein
MLLLVLSRPELLERRPAWSGGKRSTTTLFLGPLGEDESRELARGLLGGKRAPESLLDLVLARAGGNPLFMEEMLRSLIERGVLREAHDQWELAVPVDQVTIPDTVHAVIAARIDALPAAEKRALQAAAVIGKDFWLGALRGVSDENHTVEAIGALAAKDLIVRKPLSTLVGEEEITFRHILIRDVAYAMIPKAQRWPMHARHAEWLRKIIGDRQAEYADFIAYHWLQVIALRKELGQLPDPNAHAQAVATCCSPGTMLQACTLPQRPSIITRGPLILIPRPRSVCARCTGAGTPGCSSGSSTGRARILPRCAPLRGRPAKRSGKRRRLTGWVCPSAGRTRSRRRWSTLNRD